MALSYDVASGKGSAPVMRPLPYKPGRQFGEIARSAARFTETLAAFGADEGMEELFQQKDWVDRRDWIAVGPRETLL